MFRFSKIQNPWITRKTKQLKLVVSYHFKYSSFTLTQTHKCYLKLRKLKPFEIDQNEHKCLMYLYLPLEQIRLGGHFDSGQYMKSDSRAVEV